MKHRIIAGFIGCVTAITAHAQPASIYENDGIVDGSPAPQIDAIAFANYGSFTVGTTIPYDFQNTRYFTNSGTMTGNPGFQFDTAFSLGLRQPAVNLVNEAGGVISADDGGGGFIFSGPFIGLGSAGPTYLLISSENIANQGLLSVGAAGLLQVKGANVDLVRGGLEVRPLLSQTSFNHFLSDSNFFPDSGLSDNYWAFTNDFNMPSTGIISGSPTNGLRVTTPQHVVTNSFGGGRGASLVLRGPLTAGNTNSLPGNTNVVIQGVFVALSDTNIFQAAVRFAPSPIFTNAYKTVVVEISMSETNVVTGNIDRQTVYITDMLASNTNITVLTNLNTITPATTYMPANFDVTRGAPQDWTTGAPGNLPVITNNIFYDTTWSNVVVTNLYAAYSFHIDPVPIEPPTVSGLTIDQSAGRVEVFADNLDLTKTRIRGNSLVTIKTPNLLGSSNAIVDSVNLNFDLAAPGRTLKVQNLAKDTVIRFGGDISTWSANWTNYGGFLSTNSIPDPNDPNAMTNAVVTNVVEIGLHALVIDATRLIARQPVVTHDLLLTGDNVVISDAISLIRSFRVNSENLDITGRLTIGGAVDYWRATNTPTLKYFTNEGAVVVANTAFFGADRFDAGTQPDPLVNFVNRGSFSASGLKVRAQTLENSGQMAVTADGFDVSVDSGVFQIGQASSVGDMRISANDLKFHNYTNTTSRALYLTAFNSLADSGPDAGNLFASTNGIHLDVKPQRGDLLGTTVQLFTPKFALVESTWAGENRGASASGYQDNVAIGRLVLNVTNNATLRFSGAGDANGLYVDFLEFGTNVMAALTAEDLGSVLEVAPNLTIYFADSNVPADQLDGALNGRIKWVSSFAGPNSSVDVIRRSDNQTVQMNRALRESPIIDSDNDGIANQSDAFPLDPDTVGVARTGTVYDRQSSTLSFTWEAQAGTTYVIEYTEDLGSSNWQVLQEYSNTGKSSKIAAVTDRVTATSKQRYYRVRPR